MNLQVNDPNVPAPGEMVPENENNANNANGVGPSSPRPSHGSPMILPRDPHHSRTPSLGELHQELEEEQEAQVVCPQGGVLLDALQEGANDKLPEPPFEYDSTAAASTPTTPGRARQHWHNPRGYQRHLGPFHRTDFTGRIHPAIRTAHSFGLHVFTVGAPGPGGFRAVAVA